jgi:hypothetical protein
MCIFADLTSVNSTRAAAIKLLGDFAPDTRAMTVE